MTYCIDGFLLRLSCLLLGFVLLSCQEEPRELPEYMISRTKNHKCQNEESYIQIEFPDSVMTMVDRQDSVVMYHSIVARGVGFKFSNEGTGFNIRITLLGDFKPEDLRDFIYPGYYRFEYFDEKRPDVNKGIILSLWNYDLGGFGYIVAPLESNYFQILGIGDEPRLTRVCGKFDVVFNDTNTGQLVPAKGEFNVIMGLY